MTDKNQPHDMDTNLILKNDQGMYTMQIGVIFVGRAILTPALCSCYQCHSSCRCQPIVSRSVPTTPNSTNISEGF